MDSYCSIPPWILSVPPHSRPDFQVPLVSSSLLVPCLTCGRPSQAKDSPPVRSKPPSPDPKTAPPTQLGTASPSLTLGSPARAVFPFQDSVREFSLPRKMPPTLTSPGKCHFCLSGIISTLWALHSGPECSSPHAVLDGLCRWSPHRGSRWAGALSGKGLPVCVHLAECCLARVRYPILKSVTLTKLGYLLQRITLFSLGK